MNDKAQGVLDGVIRKALAAGADSADALLADATDLSVSLRLGEIESLEQSVSADLGLRVFIGKKQAVVSSSDRGATALDELVQRAVAMAKLAPEDEFCGIADPGEVAKTFPQVEMADEVEFSAEQLIAQAREAEDAARAVAGVTNSDGVSAGWGESRTSIAASNGFYGSYRRTGYSLSASVLAGSGTGMERDYDYASRVFAADMPAAASIGKAAGERAVRRLNPCKMETAQAPVFYEPRIAGSLIGSLLGAISGSAVARGTSFLKDRLGQKIFPGAITITEDPHRARGLRSRLFDAEGLLPQRRDLIDKGVLTTWLLDLRSARQLKLRSTGHASRGTGGPPSPSASNVFLQAGTMTPQELMRDVKQGFYVTETMGMGINGVTGDYSQAASGFWIENGIIAFPVNEMTIAGNLKDMFLNLSAANDLQFLRGVDAPTLRVDGMTIAGL
ncbi:MAG: TldD/PmbA family protein [Alphaproteobacteria bacterium]|nr:TldD/PmbA family protein [Alphaproteobacteria bacterium]